jgi:hypothetical protein
VYHQQNKEIQRVKIFIKKKKKCLEGKERRIILQLNSKESLSEITEEIDRLTLDNNGKKTNSGEKIKIS